MEVREPQKRRRGFFLHSETGEPDTGEHETAEGIATRNRISRSETPRQFSSVRRSRAETGIAGIDESRATIRSGSVTGSRQRAHLPR
jgi:hypothetical protein